MKTGVVALGVFAGGVVAGALLHGGTGRGATEAVAAQRASDRDGGGRMDGTRGDWSVEGFLNRIHEAGDRPVAADEDFAPEAKMLGGWSNEDFARALNEAVAGPDAMLVKTAAGAAARALLRAWMLKDHAACLACLEGMKSESMRIALVKGLAWPPGSEEEALNYSLAHPGTYPNYMENSALWARGMSAVALRGPAALEEALAAMRATGQLPQVMAELKFPLGFDFAALVKGPEGARLWHLSKTEVALGWLKQDRDAAFQAMLDYKQEKPWWTLERGLVAMNPDGPIADPELAGWIAGKLQGLEEQDRKKMIEAEMKVLRADPAALASFANGLSPEDRRGVDEYAVRAIHQIGPEAALNHLEALGTPAERIAYLESMEVIVTGDQEPPRPDRLDLEQMPAFQGKLASWGATPEQIEKISNRLEVHP